MITPEMVLKAYQDSLQQGQRDLALFYLQLMGESCPFYSKANGCLDTKFCPDCSFYKEGGLPVDQKGEKQCR